ncbi:hypothetical protein FQA39_LY08127 [Lamprigera yunnana]|nr:hypothetical protein FQA39_LY08127 [Lamprigera yunnana]
MFLILFISLLTQALSANCDGLQELNTSYKDCLLSIISQNFKDDENLHFVSSEGYDDVPFGKLPNPYVVVDINKPILLELKIARNFIILRKNEDSLDNLLGVLNRSVVWSKEHSPKGKYVIITFTEQVSAVLRILWARGIIDVVVMIPSCTTNHSLYMANPFENGNDCGSTASVMIKQSCSVPLKREVEIPIKSLGGLLTLVNSLNGTVSIEDRLTLELNLKIKFSIHIFNVVNEDLDNSMMVYRQDLLWIAPPPITTSPIETITTLFQIEVWLLTGFTFLFTNNLNVLFLTSFYPTKFLTLKMKWLLLSVVIVKTITRVSCFIPEETGVDYKDCLLRVIRQNFHEDETLCIVFSENHERFAFNGLTNPYIVVNIKKPILLKQKFVQNYIVFEENEERIFDLLSILRDSTVWNYAYSPKGKLVIITNARKVSSIFEKLWLHGIIDVIVLIPDHSANYTLYMSNPFEEGNNCGSTSSTIFNQSCSATLVKAVQIPVKNLSGCKITFSKLPKEFPPYERAVKFLLKELARDVNGTVSIADDYEPLHDFKISLFLYFNVDDPGLVNTKVVYQQNWIWITPGPSRVFSIETIVVLFTIEVWILTGFILIFTIIIWWLIVATTRKSEQLGNVFINFVSLTLGGTISLTPKMKVLRCIFFIYSLYAMIIQTAYKTNLIYVFTLPKHTSVITSANEIVDLKLPVCTETFYKYVIDNVLQNPKDRRYRELKKLLFEFDNYRKCFDLMYSNRNTTILMVEVKFSLLKEKHVNLNSFVDNRLTGYIQFVFVMKKGHYFIKNINKIITLFEESGIYQKIFKHSRPTLKENINDQTFLPLNLQNLYSTFLLLITGLILSFIVFIVEYLYHTYLKNYIRTCIKRRRTKTGYRTRRGEKYLPSGSGAKPIKKWVYFDSLMFLELYMTERNTSTNLKKVSNNTTNRSLCNNVSSQSYAKAYMLNGKFFPMKQRKVARTEEYNSQTNPHVDDETYSPSVSDAPSTPEGPTSGSRKKRKSKLNPVDETFLTFFEKKHESTAKREKSSNELFLASLLEDMNKLQQDDLRKFKIIMLSKLGEFLDKYI